MNWNLISKSVVITGILLIPLNLFYWYLSLTPLYIPPTSQGIVVEGATQKEILLFIGLSLLAFASIFRFIYRRTEKFRMLQAILTIILSEVLGYILSFFALFVLTVIGN